MLDSVMDPKMIMTRVWGELCPRLLKMLNFMSPLKFRVGAPSSDCDDRAYCAPWDKDHARAAFKGPGFYLSSICLQWLNLAEQPGEFASWRNLLLCAQQFWLKPNPDPPHLTGWVQDASIFESVVMPGSIKLRGSFELMGGWVNN